jgi:hypothetical protein
MWRIVCLIPQNADVSSVLLGPVMDLPVEKSGPMVSTGANAGVTTQI